jgi:hypothetical protein
MTTLETLRNELIDQILLTKNEKLLQAIHEIFHSTKSDDKIELNSYQMEMIQMGLNDIKEGNIISESDLEKQDAEWMNLA